MSQITPDTKDAKLRKGNNNPKLLTRIISKFESCYNRLKSEVRKKKWKAYCEFKVVYQTHAQANWKLA